MKKIISLILCILLLFSFAAFAEENTETVVGEAAVPEEEIITVMINGEALETPIAPQLVNDRTMLPMRAIFEALGARVSWFEKDQMIFATKADMFITLKIGAANMSVQTAGSNENNVIALDVAPYIDSDHTLVPARAVAEALSAKVDWVQETNTVVITTE